MEIDVKEKVIGIANRKSSPFFKVKLYILFKSQDLENISGSVAHTRIGQIRECPTPPRGWTIHSNVCRSSSTAFYNKNMYMFRFIFVSNALKRRKAVVNLYESECLGFNLIKINAFSCCEKNRKSWEVQRVLK